MPAEKIRKAAICVPDNPSMLTFIKIKELPQIKQSRIKIDQLISLLFIKRKCEGHKTN